MLPTVAMLIPVPVPSPMRGQAPMKLNFRWAGGECIVPRTDATIVSAAQNPFCSTPVCSARQYIQKRTNSQSNNQLDSLSAEPHHASAVATRLILHAPLQ
mmetsp:Transcript_16109/g.44625  ORF Transcript_16109/g.44625 Transcript_16109/m.44625 type:complete len:100 (+) Transcript_16109:391-690(+)